MTETDLALLMGLSLLGVAGVLTLVLLRRGAPIQLTCNVCGRETKRLSREEFDGLTLEEVTPMLRCERCLDVAEGRSFPVLGLHPGGLSEEDAEGLREELR